MIHLIPAEEVDLHDVSTDCVCCPTIVPEENLLAEGLAGEINYQHNPFSPIAGKRGEYAVIQKADY